MYPGCLLCNQPITIHCIFIASRFIIDLDGSTGTRVVDRVLAVRSRVHDRVQPFRGVIVFGLLLEPCRSAVRSPDPFLAHLSMLPRKEYYRDQ